MNLVLIPVIGILLGLITTFVFDTKTATMQKKRMPLNIAIGLGGAILGVFFAKAFGLRGNPIEGLHVSGLLAATLGAAVFLFVAHILMRKLKEELQSIDAHPPKHHDQPITHKKRSSKRRKKRK